MSHKRRINELKRIGYPDNHPLIELHLRHLASLDMQLKRISRGGEGNGDDLLNTSN